ncbi:MAG: tetratricopeptide repeat protein [Pirellulales bacterium]|nr:tetratricopeptide repeat protein [Pirellulales bacterium]
MRFHEEFPIDDRNPMGPLAFALVMVLGLLGAARAAEPADRGAAEAKPDAAAGADAGADPLLPARRLWLAGKYEEAEEALEPLRKSHPAAAALAMARTRESVGKLDEARQLLEEALAALPPDAPKPADDQAAAKQRADLEAELARLAFERGDIEQAAKRAAAAREANGDHLLARWVDAQRLRDTGQLDEAEAAVKWFVDYYNAHEIRDADEVRIIGLAAAEYARWKHLSDQFQFLINELYPQALEIEPGYWQARYEAGRLFVEKYNEAEATKELQAALKLNPRAAEVYAAIAELALQRFDFDQAKPAIARALEINPNCLAARRAKADLLLANFEVAEAVQALEDARRLNPLDEETLGRLATAYLIADGVPQIADGEHPDLDATLAESRAGKLLAEVNARNPHAGVFYFTLATRLEERRQFPLAELCFREALARMPQLVGPQAALGLMYMRLGEEAQAKQLLEQSFEADPFHVRVSNMLKVLEVLDTYETLETEHFVIKFDPQRDKLLAQYTARHLEKIYPELCGWLGYQPRGKSLFEIFSRARNTDGHGWFSARMVGLPYIGTVGACAGKMVALTSPNDGQRRFNWARVLEHEFVHVINLQQTRYNIPHWFTEALATMREGYPRPPEWNALLLKRVAKGEVFNLDTINFGFIRPQSGDDWSMAYCQAELYAEYIQERFGGDAIAKLLAAYAGSQNTREVLRQALGVEQSDFEEGYQKYVGQIVAEFTSSEDEDAGEELPQSFAELERAQQADPDNSALLARLAAAQLARKAYPEARRLARRAAELSPREPLAAYVIARLHLLVGDDALALETLEAAHDPEKPHATLANLLAGLKLKAKDYAGAERLYRALAEKQPHDQRWPKALARLYLLSKQEEALGKILDQLARWDGDDIAYRKKLADLKFQARDYEAAAEWSRRALHIDVTDAQIHRRLAAALLESKDTQGAIDEYQVAIDLTPDDPDLRYALADAYLQLPDKDKARATLETLLEQHPQHAAAKALLESIDE